MKKFLPLLLLFACAAPPADAPPPPSYAHPITGKPTGLPIATGEQTRRSQSRSDAPPDDAPVREPMYELPPLEDPVVITTVNGGEHWHFKDGKPRDNTGDGWMAIVEIDGEKFYWLMMRQGSPPPGGVFYSKPWDGDPTQGWTTQLSDPTKAMPNFANSPTQINLDTHTFAQNPWSKVVSFVHFAKPGYMWPDVPPMSGDSEPGYLQRATTKTGGKTSDNYQRFRSEILMEPDTSSPYEQLYHRGSTYQGSSCEESLVIAPPYAILFWEHKTWGEPDWTGQVFKGRIHRAWTWLWNLDKRPNFQRLPDEGYVFDPVMDLPGRKPYADNNKDAVWGTANVTLRSGITMNPNDNVLHMIYQAGRPQVRSDGKPANGSVNDSMGFAHCWSDDYGWHWNWDSANPIFKHQQLPGYTDNGTANHLNSPFVFFDPDAPQKSGKKGRGWLMFWGNPVDTMNQPGTRFYAMGFDLP